MAIIPQKFLNSSEDNDECRWQFLSILNFLSSRRKAMYTILRHILFFFDAEAVHYFSMRMFRVITSVSFIKDLIRRRYSDSKNDHPLSVFGLEFKNRVGLAAGFDKNALFLKELSLLGFGHIEVGTVTPLPQDGNPKPRLFRLVKDKALINRMGFNNAGAEAVANALSKFNRTKKVGIIIGGNIGKNKITPNENAWLDYCKCFDVLHSYVDYFVVNVSSPNTPGLRELQEKDSLKKILISLQQRNSVLRISKPILLKIAPDLTLNQVDEVIDLAMEINLNGLVISNTTISRVHLISSKNVVENIGQGGLSGKPLADASTALLRYVSEKSKGRIPVIASGGIFTASDAQQKLADGASLVQVWTGFVYEGPGIVKKINKGLNSI